MCPSFILIQVRLTLTPFGKLLEKVVCIILVLLNHQIHVSNWHSVLQQTRKKLPSWPGQMSSFIFTIMFFTNLTKKKKTIKIVDRL